MKILRALSRKTFKFRLYPTRDQREILGGQLCLCCELYNAAIRERRDAWKMAHASIGLRQQSAQLPDVKAERPDAAGVYAQVLQDVLRRVDKAFRAFYGRVRRGERAGFPRFRSAQRFDSLTYPQAGFDVIGHHLVVSKIGTIKIKLHRPIEGKVKTLTIKREAGKWFACFSVVVDPQPLPVSNEHVGVDVGLTTFATLSDGTEIANPRYARHAEPRARLAQRKVARRKRGSARCHAAVCLLQGVHVHVRNQRADFHHKTSRTLVNHYGVIVVEDLNVKGLASGMLAKSVHDAGWSSFIAKLSYKAEHAGRTLIKVDPRGTSQTCLCGARVPKRLSDREHSCSACGLVAGRDHVSAQVILQRARTEPSSANVENRISCVA